ncbi:MAG: S8 family serine peptidase [Bacteroidia bacterium]|nr:S8 family serine peptidase [Bacteroidia bacterium]
MKYSWMLLCLLWATETGAQQPKFFIRFTDKNNSSYTISSPGAFLSAKAIQRRINQGIPVIQNDLPVNSWYIDSVRNTGAVILNPSKWLNGVSVSCDSTVLSAIQALPFVQSIVEVRRMARNAEGKVRKFRETNIPLNTPPAMLIAQNLNYGSSYNQIHLMNGEYLHDHGFLGDGMTIAVLDAGFYSVDTLPAFDSLRISGNILGTRDFVAGNDSVYEDDTHGMEVLSCIAGNIPGELVGTGPHVKVWLLRSEDVSSEYPVEEYNWVTAAEFADSVGADIISSSLGYTEFDDSTMNHTYADMNGHTCPSSVGANIAASKGMLVITSAGNNGFMPWHYISAPADGDSVMAVGAVDSAGYKAGFSSWGPSSDGDIKPNVAAKGLQTTISYPDGSIGTGNGTSFACPVLAGAIACLWQAHPGKTAREVFDAVEKSSGYYQNPGDSLGYGIPDFITADLLLVNPELNLPSSREALSIYPNPFENYFDFKVYSATKSDMLLQVFDAPGKCVFEKSYPLMAGQLNTLRADSLGKLKSGIYFIRLTLPDQVLQKKVIRL